MIDRQIDIMTKISCELLVVAHFTRNICIPIVFVCLQVQAWPGFRFTVSLAGIDEFGHRTTVNTRFMFQANEDGSGVCVLFIICCCSYRGIAKL